MDKFVKAMRDQIATMNLVCEVSLDTIDQHKQYNQRNVMMQKLKYDEEMEWKKRDIEIIEYEECEDVAGVFN